MDAETVPHGLATGNGPIRAAALERVAIVAPNWLGDAVMALPAIADLRRALPHVALAVVARPPVAPLFTLVPDIDHIVTVRDRFDRHEVAAGRFDAALLLPNSFNAAFTAWRAGIPQRWGYGADWRTPLLTCAVRRPRRLHQAAYYQHLVRALGCPSGPLVPQVEVSAALCEAAKAQLMEAGWNAQTPLTALAPGAAYGGAKRWPAEYYGTLAERVSTEGSTVVLIGSAADAKAGSDVMARIAPAHRVVNLIGRTSLPQLAGVLASCSALVTNDSGAMHLAAAIGTQVVALFGPTRERETHPLGRQAAVLTHDVWCRPCMLRECPLKHGCMRGISVEAVHAAVRGSS
ncbi:MAG: lipopolysaccharide heptosyltransferase II [Acidobacteria bacterium]|nr:lipopolysaccharide heptosyltransferase II [Acidobacteriota bacterium]